MKEGVGEAEEGAVEAVGILGNFNIPELDFGKIVHDLQLSPFLIGKLRVCLCIAVAVLVVLISKLSIIICIHEGSRNQ